jgi:hypothetical protein
MTLERQIANRLVEPDGVVYYDLNEIFRKQYTAEEVVVDSEDDDDSGNCIKSDVPTKVAAAAAVGHGKNSSAAAANMFSSHGKSASVQSVSTSAGGKRKVINWRSSDKAMIDANDELVQLYVVMSPWEPHFNDAGECSYVFGQNWIVEKLTAMVADRPSMVSGFEKTVYTAPAAADLRFLFFLGSLGLASDSSSRSAASSFSLAAFSWSNRLASFFWSNRLAFSSFPSNSLTASTSSNISTSSNGLAASKCRADWTAAALRGGEPKDWSQSLALFLVLAQALGLATSVS